MACAQWIAAIVVICCFVSSTQALSIVSYQKIDATSCIWSALYDNSTNTLFGYANHNTLGSVMMTWEGNPWENMSPGATYDLNPCLMESYGGFSWIGSQFWMGCTIADDNVTIEVWDRDSKNVTSTYDTPNFFDGGYGPFLMSPLGNGGVFASRDDDGLRTALTHFDAGLTNPTIVTLNGRQMNFGYTATDSTYLYITYTEGDEVVFYPAFLLTVDPRTMTVLHNVSLPTNYSMGYWSSDQLTVDIENQQIFLFGSTYGLEDGRWTGVNVYRIPTLELLKTIVVARDDLPSGTTLLTEKSYYFCTSSTMYQMDRRSLSIVSQIPVQNSTLQAELEVQWLTDGGLNGKTRYIIVSGDFIPNGGGYFAGGLVIATADEQ